MGAADVVPGVSGGTVAFVLGIYSRLIDTIRDGTRVLVAFGTGDVRHAWQRLKELDLEFLLPLLAGIGIAVLTLAQVIEVALQDHPEAIAGLFFGLVAASVWMAWQLLRTPRLFHVLILVAVSAVTFVVLGFQSDVVVNPSPAVFFGAGAIAICAMILPGISGSLILLMIGMYASVIGAVDDRAFGNLVLFAAGAVLGLALFSSLLGWILDRAFDPVMAALIGLMAGSLRVLWPWPHGVGVLSENSTEVIVGTGMQWPNGDTWAVPTLLAFSAAMVVIVITKLAVPKTPVH